MTKIKPIDAPTGKQLMENIEYSPYYRVALKVLSRRGNDNPNIADLFETFHEIAVADGKLNKGVK